MAESPPPTLIVKIGSEGDVHLNLNPEPSSLERMQETVTRLNQAGGIVIYYPESPYHTSSESAMVSFKQLLALKPRILMGNNAPPEWGRLDWVEVQRNPGVSRLFFSRGARFLLSPAATPDQPKQSVMVGGPLQGDDEDRFFKAMDLSIRAARVLETLQQGPETSMDDKAATLRSLHIRIGYATRRWASAYPADEIPSNIASFDRDLWWLVGRTFASPATGRKLSGEEVLGLLESPKQR